MNAQCQAARRALEDETGLVDPEVAGHLAECRACAAHAGLLKLLDGLQAGEADEAAARRVLLDLPLARWQLRRASSWVPLAGGVALAGAGFALVGGLPAGGTLATLPSGLYATISTAVLDALVAVRSSADAIRALLTVSGSSAVLWLALSALAGSLGVRALLRRPARGRE